MGERKKKKGNLPVLTQPQSVSAEGNYYSVSWSVKLCGSGFLVLVLHGDSGGALMQFWASGGLSSFLGIFKLHSVSLLWSWTFHAPGKWCWFTAPWRSAVSAGMLCIKRRDTESSLKVSWVCLLHANGALRGNGCWVAGMPGLAVL